MKHAPASRPRAAERTKPVNHSGGQLATHTKMPGDEVTERYGSPKKRWSIANVIFEGGAAGCANEKHGPAYGILRQGGQPLDTGAKRHFEKHFGHDLGNIRIHSGDEAHQAAKSINAAAYTVGSDIVFARGRYQPDTITGRVLLQHELRHAEQQRFASHVEFPAIDSATSTHEKQARSLFDPRVRPLAEQRIQMAPEGEFSIGDGMVDSIGRSAFGDTTWPFLKAVLEGFVGGLQKDVQAGRADKAKDHLKELLRPWNAVKFYGGYLLGLVLGLISPITDLIKGVIGLLKLAGPALVWMAKWSAIGVAVSPERQKKIQQLQEKVELLGGELANSLVEFAKNPRENVKKFRSFLDDMMTMALGQAREIGAKGAHAIFDFLDKEFFDMGQSIGEVIGALIAQVLLLVFSEAIGNLISKGASFVGKMAEFVAGKAVEVFEWMKGFCGEVVGLLRKAAKGALKLFEGLANKAIEAFDALKALFVEGEALESEAAKTAAAAGKTADSAEKGADVINLAAEREKRALAAKARARQVARPQKMAAGAENQPVTASFSDEDIGQHLAEETKHHGPGDQLNPEDVGDENIRKTRTVRTAEYDPWSGDSSLLGERMGPPPGPGYEAHHMVPAGEDRAAVLRDFLKKRGWKDINDADNGVWLPRGSQTRNLGAEFKHEFTFDNAHFDDEYFTRMEEILMKDPKITPSGIRLKLRGIRMYLKDGRLPPSGL